MLLKGILLELSESRCVCMCVFISGLGPKSECLTRVTLGTKIEVTILDENN